MIEIVPYQAAWAAEFREIAGVVRRGMGATAVRIDHIGSTAVAGLAAKDVVDVQISVAALDDDVHERLSALGYRRVPEINGDHAPPNESGPADDWRKWFYRAPPGQRRTNTHVRVMGRPNQRYSLLFRDYLRAHPATAAAYAELKRRLARELKDDDSYPDVKDPAVDLIYLAAVDWAEAAGWTCGPSGA
jgi:GrpB-like predicted nucleotidyltransferase (UPF0157 family)